MPAPKPCRALLKNKVEASSPTCAAMRDVHPAQLFLGQGRGRIDGGPALAGDAESNLKRGQAPGPDQLGHEGFELAGTDAVTNGNQLTPGGTRIRLWGNFLQFPGPTFIKIQKKPLITIASMSLMSRMMIHLPFMLYEFLCLRTDQNLLYITCRKVHDGYVNA